MPLATREEVESLRNEVTTLKGMLKPSAPAAAAAAAPAPAAVAVAKTPAAPVKAATPVPSRPTTAERLTGKALLDSLFFPPGGR